MDIRILPPEEMIDVTITLPLSKSVANRQLIINALTPGATSIPAEYIPDADDSQVLASALETLRLNRQATLDVHAAGTAFRFLTAMCAATEGVDVTIDGTDRLRHRPIATLVEALRTLGAEIEYTGENDFAPLHIKGKRLKGGTVTLNPSESSQFVSALMMIAPLMDSPLTIDFGGEEPVSRPYIRMTASQMQRAGVDVEISPFDVKIFSGTYRPIPPYKERDWTAASYWYSLSAISAGFITLADMKLPSLQGDSAVADMYRRLGVVTSPSDEEEEALQLTPDPEQFSRFEQDLTDNPDLAQTIAVTSAMLGIPFHLTGLSTLRNKETDRLNAMQRELHKFGIIAEIRNDSELVWNLERHPIFEEPEVETYDDHRMAMSFAPAAIFVPALIIRNAEVVSKSYPTFWDDLRKAGFEFTDASADNTTETGEDTKEVDK